MIIGPWAQWCFISICIGWSGAWGVLGRSGKKTATWWLGAQNRKLSRVGIWCLYPGVGRILCHNIPTCYIQLQSEANLRLVTMHPLAFLANYIWPYESFHQSWMTTACTPFLLLSGTGVCGTYFPTKGFKMITLTRWSLWGALKCRSEQPACTCVDKLICDSNSEY